MRKAAPGALLGSWQLAAGDAMQFCVRSGAVNTSWAGQLGHAALPNLLLETFRVCIEYVELTILALSSMVRSRDSNRREGGTVPFKNLAGLAVNAWPGGAFLGARPLSKAHPSTPLPPAS